MNDPNKVYADWADKQAAMGRRIVPEDQHSPIPEAYTGPQPAADQCICEHYVVDHSDPERYHPENIDREPHPDCPVHPAPEERT